MSYLIKGDTGNWEVVIGLEVHAQVVSQAKLFSGASAAFGAAPNTQVSYVDAGMPGMLPVINRLCVEQAVKTGLGLKAHINRRSVFARKNYFYADLPQGYQISQYDQPIVGEGTIVLDMPDGSTRAIGVERLHLEQDAGKSIHDMHPQKTFIDLNRSGVALMEIVSKPDLRSPEEAGQYLRKLHSILASYLQTCDGNMEEGSMRCDANVSVRPAGSNELRTRCEIKNVNSVRFVMQAIEHEARRHVDVYEGGGAIVQETRLYDSNRNETRTMRSKEMAHDYRYFPDPDLPPLIIDEALETKIRASMPEMPDEKKERFTRDYGTLSFYGVDDQISVANAIDLVKLKKTADYFENMVQDGAKPRAAFNWLLNEYSGRLNQEGLALPGPISASANSAIVQMISSNEISGKIAKEVADIAWNQPGSDPRLIVEQRGLKQVTDTGAIDAAIDQILAANPDKVAEYRSGKDTLMRWFVGQVMKATQGKVNPGLCGELLKKKLAP